MRGIGFTKAPPRRAPLVPILSKRRAPWAPGFIIYAMLFILLTSGCVVFSEASSYFRALEMVDEQIGNHIDKEENEGLPKDDHYDNIAAQEELVLTLDI
ncbi:uncharacterized protein G2W53_025693 [Senna tora]|uniref:Uncharacterized protein n=1 Tax=Senna tora TaxID=362788 RepID=A0A834TE12_9FABA|nr:uncharacterized protein G2W53_025693 [Senna tora]